MSGLIYSLRGKIPQNRKVQKHLCLTGPFQSVADVFIYLSLDGPSAQALRGPGVWCQWAPTRPRNSSPPIKNTMLLTMCFFTLALLSAIIICKYQGI